MDFKKLSDIAGGGLHRRIVDDVPSLKRGQVWCQACGYTEKVDAPYCLGHGWPMHCGQTMTIESPQERQQAQR